MNSLKTFMNKVGERVREVAPPGSPSIIDGTDPQNTEMEGFVCPSCFQNFSLPEALEKHYSDVHLDPSANYLCPVCKARLNSQTELEMHYSANHGNRDFDNHSIEALKEELIEMSTNLREERWYSEELKKEVSRLQEAFKKKDADDSDSENYVHKTQLDAVEESKSLLSSEVVLLRKQLAESLSQSSSMRNEKDSLEKRASELAVEKAELCATLDSLQADKVNVEAELSNFNSHSSVMEATRKDQMDKLCSEVSRLEEILESKDKELLNSKENEKALQQDLKMKSEAFAEIKEETRNLKMDFDLMKKKLQEKTDLAVECEAKVKEYEVEIKDLTEKLSATEIAQVDKVKVGEAQKMTTDEPEKRNSELETYESEIENLKLEMQQKDSEIDSLKCRVKESESGKCHAEDLAREKLKLIDDLKDAKYDVQKTLENVKNKMSDADQNLRDKDQTIDMLNEKVEQLYELRKQLEANNCVLLSVQQELEKQKQISKDFEENIHERLREVCVEKEAKTKLEVELEECKTTALSDKENLVKKINTLEERLCKSTEEIERLQSELQGCNVTATNYKEKLDANFIEITNLKSSVESLKSDKSNLEKEIETISSRHINLEKEFESNAKSNTNLQNEILLANTKLKEISDEKIKMSTDFKNQLSELQSEISTVNKERNVLAENIKLLEAFKVQIETEINLKLEEIEALNSQLVEFKTSTKSLTEEIIECNNQISTRDERNESLSKEIFSLTNNITTLEDSIKMQKARITELDSSLSSQEVEMAAIAGDKLELEVKLEASMEEQQGLLERCVAAETEVERVQQQLAQLRRKLVDSTAALHELGRENQSLQMETAKLAGRVWTEDSEVNNCAHCNKTFSMTVRKHHCRNCYQIFCNDCSSKNASLESNKKPVRVCDSCHSEISSRS